MIEEIGQGGADVIYSATGWTGHSAYIDPNVEEFKADTLEEFCKLGSRLTTLNHITMCQNSLSMSMGGSGDIWNIPPRAATIGPRDIVNARERVEMHTFVNPGGDSWQRMISRIELYGPISKECPASILRLGKGTCYVSEGIAKPFKCRNDMRQHFVGRGRRLRRPVQTITADGIWWVNERDAVNQTFPFGVRANAASCYADEVLCD